MRTSQMPISESATYPRTCLFNLWVEWGVGVWFVGEQYSLQETPRAVEQLGSAEYLDAEILRVAQEKGYVWLAQSNQQEEQVVCSKCAMRRKYHKVSGSREEFRMMCSCQLLVNHFAVALQELLSAETKQTPQCIVTYIYIYVILHCDMFLSLLHC